MRPLDHVLKKSRDRVTAYISTRDTWPFAPSLTALTAQAAREYEDRFLLELIQNGYDAHPKGARDGRILILLDDDEGSHGVLYVANTGSPFSASNFEALCEIAQSDKRFGEGIGNKGIGFKSVLQICDRPEIYSADPTSIGSGFGGYCFGFASDADYLVLADEDSALKSSLENDISPLFLPVPRDPDHLDALSRFAVEGFATVVRLPLRSAAASEAAGRAITGLVQSSHPVMLFLERLSELVVEGPTVAEHLTPLRLTRSARPIERGGTDSVATLELVHLGDGSVYLVGSRQIPEYKFLAAIQASIKAEMIDADWAEWTGEAPVQIAVRIDDEGEDEPRLYCYLPMGEEARAPFFGHANAPFFTRLARVSISRDVPLNSLLLDEAAELALDTIDRLKGMDADWRNRAIVDLLCWEGDRQRLEHAFSRRERGMLEDPILPLLERTGGQPFGSLRETYAWTGEALTTLVPDRVADVSDARILALDVDSERGERLQRFTEAVVEGGLRPALARVADWAEDVATWLHARPLDAKAWGDLYEDLAVCFHTSPKELAGRRIILDSQGQLRQTNVPESHARRGPTVFFFPSRERADDEEELDLGPDFRIPTGLRSRISFTRPDLVWHRQDGQRRVRTEARKLFQEGELVRPYRTRDVVEHVAEVLERTTSDRTRRDALGLAFRIDRTGQYSQHPTIGEIGLFVPSRGGWIPADEALFSADWGTAFGPTLETLIEAAGPGAREIADLASRLLLPPAEWPFPVDDPAPWRGMLVKAGVRDGLHPTQIEGTDGIRAGSDVRPEELAKQLEDEIAQEWLDFVKPSTRPVSYRQSNYRFGSKLRTLPGQRDFKAMGDAAKIAFATLVGSGLAHWEEDAFRVQITRQTQGGSRDDYVWPTPVSAFLERVPWVPISAPGEGKTIAFVRPKDAWHLKLEDSDETPRFASTTTREFRRVVNGTPRGHIRLFELGARAWDEPTHAPDLLVHLGLLLQAEEVPAGHHMSLRKLYEGAWRDVVRGEMPSPFRPGEPAPLIVSGRDGLAVIDLGSPAERDQVYVVDVEQSLVAELLRALDVPLLDLDPRVGKAVAELLEAQFPGHIRPASSVDTELQVDGAALPLDAGGIRLVDDRRGWITSLVICSVELTPNRFVRRKEKGLRRLSRDLSRIRLVQATDVKVLIDGTRVEVPDAFRGGLPYQQGEELAIVTSIEPPLDWDDCEQLAPAISQLIGQPDASMAIQLAVVKLKRMGVPPDGSIPGEHLAQALSAPVSKIRQILQAIREPVEETLASVQVVLAHFLDPETAATLGVERDLATDTDLVAAVESLDVELPWTPAQLVRGCTDVEHLVDLCDRFAISFRDLNQALRELHRSPIRNAEGHAQALKYFVSKHREEILRSLRDRFFEFYQQDEPLDEYVRLREQIASIFDCLAPREEWLDECFLPDDAMLTQAINDWLRAAGAPAMGMAHRPLEPIHVVREKSLRAIRHVVERAAPIVTAWCLRSSQDPPEPWRSENTAQAISTMLDILGVLDFAALDESAILHHLQHKGLLPPEMPPSLDLATLGLSPADVASATNADERDRIEREQERKSIRLDGTLVLATPDRYVHIAQVVVESLTEELLTTQFRVDRTLRPMPPPSRKRDPDRAETERRSSGRTIRGTQEQRDAIGLVGEQIAFEWLKRSFPWVDRSAWKSTYSGIVCGDSLGDDSLGYDFAVVMRSTTLFFEVKATSSESLEFELGESEVSAARRYTQKNRYRVIFIRHALDSGARSIHLLPNPMSEQGRDFYRLVGSGLKYRFDLQR